MVGRLPKRLKELEDAKTIRRKIFDIVDSVYFDPYNGTDILANMLINQIDQEKKIIKKMHERFFTHEEHARINGQIEALENFKRKLKEKNTIGQ